MSAELIAILPFTIEAIVFWCFRVNETSSSGGDKLARLTIWAGLQNGPTCRYSEAEKEERIGHEQS